MYHQLVASRNETIIDMYNQGLSKSFIAEQFGMKKAQVSFIIRRNIIRTTVIEVVLE